MNQDIYVVIEHLRGQVADISYVMLAAANDLVQVTGGEVVAVLLGHNAQGLADDLAAKRVLYMDHPALADFTPDAYQKALAALIGDNEPRVVLFGHTSAGTDVASSISVQLELPLVSSCQSFSADGKFVSQICGGKIMAEGNLPAPNGGAAAQHGATSLVTMIPGGYKPDDGQYPEGSPELTTVEAPALEDLRVTLAKYIDPEPGDVDISKEPILIAVGRGLQTEDNLELAEELAEALGGAVCASRPIVDQGWLPISRMVGKSGQHVSPKLYLALGISGAPEHIEGIGDSELVVAINTDPAAPIFDTAQYGAEIDVLDLVEVLTERVEEAKAG